eukprot:m.134406 g.134406  ORF g.134406 m.134406 type:complete len:96 (-) comp13867_c0_seq2:1178-1465(-)
MQTFASHLAPTILRIGGTDQNNFHYNVEDTRPMRFALFVNTISLYHVSVRAPFQPVSLWEVVHNDSALLGRDTPISEPNWASTPLWPGANKRKQC